MAAVAEPAPAGKAAPDGINFPDHPVFERLPADLISFDDFEPGALVMVDGEAALEVDDEGIPTVNLAVEHSIERERPNRLKVDASVTRVSKEDAWKLGKGDLLGEEWKEPAKTLRGEFGTDKTPFHRIDRALTQFLTSRARAQKRIVHTPIFRAFRRITRIAPSTPEPHIKGSEVTDKGIASGDETCVFLVDMEGTMKGFWMTTMETAGEDFNVFTASQVFEITNSYLHYLAHYNILPEPYLATTLQRTIGLAAKIMPQMFVVEAFFRETVRPDGWIALCNSAWVQKVDETWQDGGMRERALQETGVTEEELSKTVEEGRGSSSDEDSAEFDAGQGPNWLDEDEDAADYPDLSLAPLKTVEALQILEKQIAPTQTSAFKVLRQMTATPIKLVSAKLVTEGSAALPSLVGKIALQLDIVATMDQVCALYLDRTETIKRHAHGLQRILDSASGLAITADWIEIGEATPANVLGRTPIRWWIATNVVKGSSPLLDG